MFYMVNAIDLVEENIKGLEKLTEEHLEKFAKQFTLDTWGMRLNIPVLTYKRESNRNGFFRYNKRFMKPVEIKINLAGGNNEEILDTLKHELCHWYCFVSGLNFKDGDKDFESILNSVGACSTYSRGKDKDKLYQQAIMTNQITRNGYKGTKFDKLDNPLTSFELMSNGTRFDRRYYKRDLSSGFDTTYNGEYIGSIFKVDNGSWVAIDSNGKLYPSDTEVYAYRTRKHVSELLVLEHLEK